MTRRMAALAVVVLLLALIADSLARALPTQELMDFGSFYASGEAAAAGHDPYGVYPLTFHVVLPGFEAWNPNLNPPVALPLFELFTVFEPHDAFRRWWAVSILLYVAAVGLLLRRHRKPLLGLWAFSLAGFWDTLVLGQIYLALVLAAVGAWTLLERERPLAAGLLIGLVVAVKPNFLVWPALLLLAGHRKPVWAAAASVLVLNLMALLLYGPTVYLQWVGLIASDGQRAVFLTNASLAGLAQRLGSPELGTVLSLALLGALAVKAARGAMPVPQASALGLIGAVLASPIAWVHYTLFLLPVFFTAPASPLLWLSAALLVVPVPLVLELLDAAPWVRASFGSVYGWAVILCLAALWKPTPPEVAHSPHRVTPL